jgi:hypothetical protein
MPTTGPSAHVSETATGGFIRLSEDSKATSISLDAPPAKVWAALPAVYRKLGITPDRNDAATMTIGTQAYTQSRLDGRRTLEWMRCGNQGAGPSSGGMVRTRFTILSTVRPAANDRSDLVTTITGTATPVEGTSTGPVSCTSTGDLEQRIRSLVVAELTGG